MDQLDQALYLHSMLFSSDQRLSCWIFQSWKELGQCDFLFILAMEGLNNMVKKAKHIGWVDGSEIERRDNSSMEITHLLYEDDTQIFCDAKVDQLKFLRVILVLFLVCILIGAKAHCIQLM